MALRPRDVASTVVALLALLALLAHATNAHAEDEVTVRGVRRRGISPAFAPTPNEQQLTGEELREIPGAFGDPGRAMETMPGVSTIASILPFYFVRGSTPANTGYFVDGVRVPFLSHAPPGTSFVAPSLIDRAHFYPGAAPARFGRVVGGTMSVDLRPPAERRHVEGGIRMYDANIIGETPILNGRGSVLVGGRLGYSQLLLAALSNERQQYWDYNTRASYKLSSTETVSAVVFGSHDFAGTVNDGTRFDTEFHRVDLRYDVKSHDNKSAHRLAATIGSDVSGNGLGSVNDRILGLRAESTYRLSDKTTFEAGTNVTWDRYTTTVLSARVGDPEILFAPRDDIFVGGYVQLGWRPLPRLEIDVGTRVDMFASKRAEYPRVYTRRAIGIFPSAGEASRIGVGPRLTTRLGLTKTGDIAYVATFGVAHQPPTFLLPGLMMSRLDDGLQTAVQTSHGLEFKLPLDIAFSTTLFRHDYVDLSDSGATCPGVLLNVFDPTDPCYGRRVRGQSYGLEVLLRRSLVRRLTGWVSYTLSRSTRQAHAPGESIIGKSREAVEDVLSEWDRTHVVSALAGYDLGRGWRAGARFSFNSGRPYGDTVFGVLVPPYNRHRLPDFYRIDIRVEKRWRLSETSYIAAVLEGFNITLNREPLRCRPPLTGITGPIPERFIRDRRPDACSIDYTEGIGIPSLGVEGAF